MEKMVRNNDLNAAIDTLLKNNKGIIETDVDEDEKTTRKIIPNSLILPASNKGLVATEKTMTTKELAQVLGVEKRTINETAQRLLSGKVLSHLKTKTVKGGETWIFTEEQATLIKQEIQKHHNLSTRQIDSVSTDYEMELMTQKVLTYHIQKANEYKVRAEQAEAKVIELQPKVEFADKVLSSETLLTMSAVCKVLGLKYGCITLYKHLVKLGVLNQNHIPYQEYISRGYFKVCEGEVEDSYENVHVTLTTKVYQKGVNFIMKLLQKNNLFDTIQ